MWERIKNNPLIFWLLVIIVVFCICWLVGIGVHVDAGKGGFHFGVEHGDSGK